jgi:NhaA family Na+:H+ antiporter
MNQQSTSRLRTFVTGESTGGILLLVAALIGFTLANSPLGDGFEGLLEFRLGPSALHLDLSLGTWAADGLLAIFFFVVGVELKHELVVGSLRNFHEAAVPVVAAVGGMVLPAAIYVAIVVPTGDVASLKGWAVPTATDIAFALAVLAVFGRGLPRALRTFLLTLAVVDDLLAIIVIAVFYTEEIHLPALAGAALAIAAFGWAAKAKSLRWWVLLPLALLAWILMHESGVHATIAGVALGLTVPAVAQGTRPGRTHYFEGLVRPWSSGVALPVFAFFAAGVPVVGSSDDGLAWPVFTAVLVGLMVGKLFGVLGATALVTRFTPLRLPDAIGLRDLLPVGFLCGIGFTVSLLITELSFDDHEHAVAAKLGVLVASVLAAALGAITLRWDAKQARAVDMNADGRPDVDHRQIGDDSDDD